MTPLSALLAELRRLDDAATEPPWSQERNGIFVNGLALLYAECGDPLRVHSHPDAALIAFLRNHAAALADALEIQERALEWYADAFIYVPSRKSKTSPLHWPAKLDGGKSARDAIAQVAARLKGEG